MVMAILSVLTLVLSTVTLWNLFTLMRPDKTRPDIPHIRSVILSLLDEYRP